MKEDSKINGANTELVIFKNPDTLLFNKDKVSNVLSNDDTISIFLSKFIYFKTDFEK